MDHTTVLDQCAAAGAFTELLKSISGLEVVWSSSALQAAIQALNKEQAPHLQPVAECQELGGLRHQPQVEQQMEEQRQLQR